MNPFEKKAHDKRMHELIAERDDLIKQLQDAKREISNLKMDKGAFEAVCANNNEMRETIKSLTELGDKAYDKGYNDAIQDAVQAITRPKHKEL